MPLPKPRKSETKEQFISRFMSSQAAKEFKTQDQRLAVAYREWRNKSK